MPNTGGKEPGALEAHTLPSLVPSHSMFLSSERNATPPLEEAISHPRKFLGNSQMPSVTVRERSKLALEVSARFLSFNSLFASVRARRSEVRSALAGNAGADTAMAAASENAAAFCLLFSWATAPVALTVRTDLRVAVRPVLTLEESTCWGELKGHGCDKGESEVSHETGAGWEAITPVVRGRTQRFGCDDAGSFRASIDDPRARKQGNRE